MMHMFKKKEGGGAESAAGMETELGEKTQTAPQLFLYNTLTREKELFTPRDPRSVSLYSCGPTVYDYAHIGNMRAFVFSDTLKRSLIAFGYGVRHVINITDFGHLTSDADEGEDKMMKGLRREGKEPTLENMLVLASFYMEKFFEDLRTLGVDTERITFPRASDHVEGMVAIIKTLEEKGYAYETSGGVYFDISRFPRYGSLGNISLDTLEAGARVEENNEKRNPADFALWKKNPDIGWESPWGRGFPGWHIECTAMIFATLGRSIDIHTGGIDHIPVHHNNELAQAESASGKPYVRYWLHNEHLKMGKTKIAKSLGNAIQIRQLVESGFSPLVYRYWLLTAHYRSPISFSWEALENARNAVNKIYRVFFEELPPKGGSVSPEYKEKFLRALGNDLDTPQAIAVLWELLKDQHLTKTDKRATLLYMDKSLGIGLNEGRKKFKDMLPLPVMSVGDLEEDIQALVEKREEARQNKNWEEADHARAALEEKGYDIKDTPTGPQITLRATHPPSMEQNSDPSTTEK